MLTPRSICYVGWHGQGNLGDDAIYDAVRSQLQDALFIDLPLYPRAIASSMTRALPARARRSNLLLGGGTCIGRRNWRRILQFGLSLTKGHRAFAIGAGVEDPSFVGVRSYSDKNELAKWQKILSRFEIVSVRGPQSAELLSGIGVEAEVSGDPALLLAPPTTQAVPGRIGVNLGFGDDLCGHDPQRVATEMAQACKVLSLQGHEFVGILMNKDDRKWTEMALSGVSSHVRFVNASTSERAICELAACSMVIVSRLHAAILASISGTPTVLLEYQPKCMDFARSIGNEYFSIRTDIISADLIVGKSTEAQHDCESVRVRTLDAVARLRQKLLVEYQVVRRSIQLSEIRS
jgi:polysaccharide pyruvyl transferase WcaK-like protein